MSKKLKASITLRTKMGLMKNKLFFILFLFLPSCTLISNKLNTVIDNETKFSKDIAKHPSTAIMSCHEKSPRILIESESDIPFYKQALTLTHFQSKNFLEKSLTLILLEILRRPDVTSPYSRLQIYYGDQKKQYYYDFSTKEGNTPALPLIFGIQTLAKKHQIKNISSLLEEIDSSLNLQLPVSPELEAFIVQNKNNIENELNLKDFFLKGDEPLTHFETLKKSSLKTLWQFYTSHHFDQEKLYQIDTEWKFKSIKKNILLLCNQDLKISTPETKQYMPLTNVVQLAEAGQFFTAIISGQEEKKLSAISKTSFIKRSHSPLPIPACQFQSPQSFLFLSSVEGKEKSQLLDHLIDYQIYNYTSLTDLNSYLNFPRHIILTHPDRILYESKRGSKAQINLFLQMNLPIYHVENLGQIIGLASLSQNIHLLPDSRKKRMEWCTN